MNAYTIMSARGQVVLPKDARDLLGWGPGRRLEVVCHPGGMTLRPVTDGTTKLSGDEARARLRGRSSYRGPPVSIAEMDETLREIATRRDRRR